MRTLTLILLILASVRFTFAQNNTLRFDGVDDYVTTNNAMDLDGPGNSVILEAWIYVESFPTGDYDISSIMGIEGNGAALLRLGDPGVNQPKNMLQFVLTFSGQQYKLNSTTALNTNTWYHVAAAWKSSTTVAYITINGQVDVSGSLGPGSDFTANDIFYIGAIFSPAERFFNGKIDEVRVWNADFSLATIRANMYKELSGTETGLVAYYKLNESSGTSTADAQSSASHNATLYNMTGNEWQASAAFAGPKQALDFTLDYVTISSIFGLSTTTLTVESWVYLASTSEKGAFVHIGDHDTGYGIGVGSSDWDNAGNELIVLYDLRRWIPSGINIGTGWHHVAFSIGSLGECTIYLDGVAVYVESGDPTDPLAPTGSSSIGSSQTTTRSLTAGMIDEVRIWKSTLTEQDIRENMFRALVGNETNLVGYYNFDNTSGSTLPDFTAGNNDGTLTGPVWVNSSAFNTWLNTYSSTWTEAANWSSGVPVSTDNVGIINYSGGASPVLSGTPTVNHMVIGSSAGLTLSSDAVINGNLFLYDNLDLNGQTVTLGSSARLYEAGGNVQGASGQIQTTRNLNNIDEDVAGLGAKITTSADMGSTTIIRGHEAQGPQGIERYYQINPANNSGLNATLVFNYLDSELNGLTEADLRLFKSTDGNTWAEQASSVVNTTDNTLTLSGIADFSWWTGAIQGADASLPVELASFSADAGDGWVTLKWSTASELQNQGFEILRSDAPDGEFQLLDSYTRNSDLRGAGTSNRAHDYTFTDTYVYNGNTYYYKLVDVDNNGVRTEHGPLSATPESAVGDGKKGNVPEAFALYQNSPNPFNPSTTIRFDLPGSSARVLLEVYNLLGQKITTLYDGVPEAGSYSAVWNGRNDAGREMPSGVYIYRLSTDNFVGSHRMVLMK